ncbi:MAE_28990/MAE_18760 family HEPN-like nuclease [Capilliphycus salinus ALCB114379]|uniref:MAE_28990/MAE_18760 family HEPN-like nuclease n=1 Tax=Capilliphycus salinus TaxID=2768948 RepID=UPI0039A565B2
MFDDLINRASQEISTVRAIIKSNDILRGILFVEENEIRKLLEDKTDLIDAVPSETEWQIYDHCAVVTRLYAIYERFVEDLITDWLRVLPEIVSSYSQLSEKIQNTHREGIGRLLLDINKNRFQHLSVETVVQGLFSGITATGKYELLPEAFLLHEQNLRKDILEKLFSDAGIENTWRWVIKHREIKYFVEEIRGNQNTPEGELKQLIDYRNEAAHGTIDEILGTDELLNLGDFVEALCKALAELVTYQVIQEKSKVGQIKEVGKITEWFKKPRAAVAKVKDISLTVGDNIFLVNEVSSCCKLAKIESIKINDVSTDEAQITSETEVGLKFDTDIKISKGFSLYKI